MGMLIFFLILNFLISIFNAWSCGKSWVYTKQAGGVSHFMNWMGAIMSACGFTWCYTIVIAFGCSLAGWLSSEQLIATLNLGYLAIILPLLGSGLAITVQSWVHFIRRPSLLNGGLTAWNTFAQVRNTMSAMHAIPSALEKVASALTGDSDGDNAPATIMILVVVFSILGGVLTTRWIVMSTSKKSDYFA